MGCERKYLKIGGFSEFLYETVGQARTINGVRVKVIKLKTDKSGTHSSLPQFSCTSDMYLRLGPDGLPCQAKVYIGRRMFLDFDWAHCHKNSDGRRFERGTVHVQKYFVNSDGRIERLSDDARYMDDAEIGKYGEILQSFNPNVKLRP